MEIFESDLKVMSCLLHPESFETIVLETTLSPKVALDIVRNLFHYRYIKVQHKDGTPLQMFSPDEMRDVRFVLTAKGQEATFPANQ